MTRSSIGLQSGKVKIIWGEEVKKQRGQGVRRIIPQIVTELIAGNEDREPNTQVIKEEGVIKRLAGESRFFV